MQLGRHVAVEVAASGDQRRAWVRVKPVMVPAEREVIRFGTAEPAYRRPGAEGPLQGYRIGFLEIDAHWLDYPYETDRCHTDPATITEELFAPDEATLVEMLARWVIDLSTLRIPMNVNCPSRF